MAGKRQIRMQSEGDVTGMSEDTLSNACIKNELEKWKLMNEMHTLMVGEKQSSMENRRNLRKLKDEITKMLAEGCVYKSHGFQKYDPFVASADEKENLEEGFKSNGYNKSLSMGSFPSITETSSYVKSNLKSYGRKRDRKSSERSLMSIPNTLPTIDVSDNTTAQFEDTDDENDVVETTGNLASSLALSFHGMVLWRQKIRDRIVEKERAKTEPPVRHHPKVETKNMTNRYKSMFAGNCRTCHAMKKFVEKEATIMINQVDSPLYQKRMSQIEKLKLKCQIPEIIRRDRSTSAIFRDFESYKANKIQDKKRKVKEWQVSQ